MPQIKQDKIFMQNGKKKIFIQKNVIKNDKPNVFRISFKIPIIKSSKPKRKYKKRSKVPPKNTPLLNVPTKNNTPLLNVPKVNNTPLRNVPPKNNTPLLNVPKVNNTPHPTPMPLFNVPKTNNRRTTINKPNLIFNKQTSDILNVPNVNKNVKCIDKGKLFYEKLQNYINCKK